MFKFAATLAAVASAQVETGPAMYRVNGDMDNVVITQISGADTWTMLDTDTYASPNPVQTGGTENFIVGGIWNVANVDLAKVSFNCVLGGAPVYNQDYPCSVGDANCPSPSGAIGEEWTGSFGFDVPAFAPPFVYDVTVTGKDSSDATLWELESKFTIPN